ncbi:MAG: response regulator transcription factor [Elusimicrobia bacterium]|nr:response regulator transcription factor [Elusimicrobiota bacterium]
MSRTKAGGRLKVLLVDDEVLFRDVLKDRLKGESDIQVVGEADDGEAAVRLVKELKPNVVLMDISMAGGSGIEATRKVTKAFPGTKVLMLSAFTDEAHVMEAVQAGAYGYISKKLPTQELVRALRSFAEQGTMLPSPLMQRVVTRLHAVARVTGSPLGDLTQTQMRVLALLGEGKANKEIAAELGCNVKTIKNHLNVLFQKFDVKNRTEAVVKGIRAGLIAGKP